MHRSVGKTIEGADRIVGVDSMALKDGVGIQSCCFITDLCGGGSGCVPSNIHQYLV